MTHWFVPGTDFVIDVETKTFVKQPDGNKKTVAQVISEHNARKPAPNPKRQLTPSQFIAELATEHPDIQLTS